MSFIERPYLLSLLCAGFSFLLFLTVVFLRIALLRKRGYSEIVFDKKVKQQDPHSRPALNAHYFRAFNAGIGIFAFLPILFFFTVNRLEAFHANTGWALISILSMVFLALLYALRKGDLEWIRRAASKEDAQREKGERL